MTNFFNVIWPELEKLTLPLWAGSDHLNAGGRRVDVATRDSTEWVGRTSSWERRVLPVSGYVALDINDQTVRLGNRLAHSP